MPIPYAKLLLSSTPGKSFGLTVDVALLGQNAVRAFVFIPKVQTRPLVPTRRSALTVATRGTDNHNPRTFLAQPFTWYSRGGGFEIFPSASRSFCQFFLFTAFPHRPREGPSHTVCAIKSLSSPPLLSSRPVDRYTRVPLLPSSKRLSTLATMTSSNHPMPPAELLTDKMETPALDDRSYRVIRLPNKLEALLVHDPETDKASAAMDVNVGNFSDREDMPGMAHAVEHLLFMGTEKAHHPPSHKSCNGTHANAPSFTSIREKTPITNTSHPTPAIRTRILEEHQQTTSLRLLLLRILVVGHLLPVQGRR
jgi:hypothetical protein